ncbi:MAG TPA: RraA family protein [Candidatus Acidoferrales bacterium]|jgi:regulator of RNase E activity RraA|nr:RraA family protein [Candidatus Acidoferrales bacterium]
MAKTVKGKQLTPAQLDELRQFTTCVTASAIETFGVRLYNTGFADGSIHCQFKDRPPVVGYAATARMRGQDPPMYGKLYYDRSDWWKFILTIPAPRVVVLEDVSKSAGLGAFVGAVHASILGALGCVAVVTNGTVRDIPDVRATGIQVFASNVAVSHAYAHIFEFGGTVRIGGMDVAPGDLVQGDLHGVQTIPLEIAEEVPGVAREILQQRKKFIDLSRSNDFSVEKVQQLIKEEFNVR